MNAEDLFEELEHLSPEARTELVQVFRLAARAVAERRELAASELEVSLQQLEALAYQFRSYRIVARGLADQSGVEKIRWQLIESLKVSTGTKEKTGHHLTHTGT